MECIEDNTTSSLRLQSQEPELGFTSPGSYTGPNHSVLDSEDETEQNLIQKFENVALGLNDRKDNDDDDHEDYGDLNYPLRPYAEDCSYYLKTGACKFGLNCRFNHPLRRTNQVGKDKDKDKEESSEKSGQIECKYYLTPGGCKYGKSCRYSHSKDDSEIALPEVNFLGLPIRLGEKECPFYMRNGSCGYGVQCRFHHPEPTALGGSDPHSSISSDVSVGRFCPSLGNHNGEFIPLRLSGPPQAQLSPSSHMAYNKIVPLQDNWSSNLPATHLLPREAQQNSEQHIYQAPKYPEERMRLPRPTPEKSLTKKTDMGMQVDEFPERPGKPECDYFMKTGDCKFKSACRYHHPKSRAPKADLCALSEKGLPLRPGRKICWHYEQYGICKYGRACLFDHPVNHDSSTFPTGSVLETPYDNSGTHAGTRLAGYGGVSQAIIYQPV